MRLLVMSDLHLEFSPLDEATLPSSEQYDLVILAGDVHTRARSAAWASACFEAPVVLIAGNHESYGITLQQTQRYLQRDAGTHVNILENNVLNFGTTRILGCTGWADFEACESPHLVMMQARLVMNDYKKIRVEPGFGKIDPLNIRDVARRSKAWLLDELRKPHKGKSIVVTHYPPLLRFVPDYGDPNVSPAIFGNDWPEMLEFGIDLWVFGHTHEPVDEIVDGVRFISNPRGYPQECLPFDPQLIVEI